MDSATRSPRQSELILQTRLACVCDHDDECILEGTLTRDMLAKLGINSESDQQVQFRIDEQKDEVSILLESGSDPIILANQNTFVREVVGAFNRE